MQSGMGMMMKSLGLDPEAITSNVEKFKTEITGAVASVDKRLTRIEEKIDRALFLAEQLHGVCVTEVETPKELSIRGSSPISID
jgi:hypothetical protein